VPKQEEAYLNVSWHRCKAEGKTEGTSTHSLRDSSRLGRSFPLIRKSHKTSNNSCSIKINEEFFILISLAYALAYKRKMQQVVKNWLLLAGTLNNEKIFFITAWLSALILTSFCFIQLHLLDC
jgi:hypothetical protein